MPVRPTSIPLREDGGAMPCSERHVCRRDREGDPVPLVEVAPDLVVVGDTLRNALHGHGIGPASLAA